MVKKENNEFLTAMLIKKSLFLVILALTRAISSMENVRILGDITFEKPPQCASAIPPFWERPFVGAPALPEIALDQLVTFLVEKKDNDPEKNARFVSLRKQILDRLESMQGHSVYQAIRNRIIQKYFIFLVSHYFNEKDNVHLPQPYRKLDDDPDRAEQISGYVFTPSGSHLLVATTKVCLWDIRNYQRKAPTCTFFEGDLPPGLTGLHLSEDGLTAFGATSGKIYCWNSLTGKLFRVIELPLINGKPFHGAQFSHKGDMLAVSYGERQAWLYRLHDALKKIKAGKNEEHDVIEKIRRAEIIIRSFWPRSGIVGSFARFDTPGDNTRRTSLISEMQFSHDDMYFAATAFMSFAFCGATRALTHEDLFPANEKYDNNEHGTINQIRFVLNSKYALVAERSLWLNDVCNKTYLRLLRFPGQVFSSLTLNNIEIHPVSSIIALAEYGKTPTVIMFDCKRKILVPLGAHTNIFAMSFTPDGCSLCVMTSPRSNTANEYPIALISLMGNNIQSISELLSVLDTFF